MKMKYFVIFVTFLELSTFAFGIFFPNLKTTQLCVNSDQPNIKSICVVCDAQRFTDTTKECTGQDKVPDQTSQDQALCLISSCLQQIPKQQRKIVFGRKRRSVVDIKVTSN